jgi:hypothetical protein
MTLLPLPYSVLGILLVLLSSEAKSFAQNTANQFENRVQLQVNRNRSTRIGGGDWDDRTDRITFSVKFTNGDTRQAFDGCEAEFYVIAQNILNPRAYQLLQVEKFTFSLPARGTHSLQTPEVVTRYDKTDAKHGAKYDAWVCVVRDSSGKVLMKKTSLPSWLPVADRLNEMSLGKSFDRQLKPANSY